MIDVLVLGQIVMDVAVPGVKDAYLGIKRNDLERAARFSVGGDAQNASVTMGYLGLNTWLSGKIGDDEAGRFCMGLTEAAGVNVSRVVRVSGASTATTVNLVREDGEASMLSFPGENENYRNEDVPFDLFSQARYVSLHSLFALPSLDVPEIFRKARAAGAKTFADTTTWRGIEKIEMLDEVFPVLDIFCPSYDEARQLLGFNEPRDLARAFLERGAGTAVIKLGGKGCLAASGKDVIEVPAYPVRVANTTGAGDNFTAGFLYGLCKGYSLEGAAKCGNAAGAITAGSLSSSGAVGSEQQLLDFIARGGDSLR
jgi:sugar/nucleoside kinase (ribokinase family)